MNDPINHPAHYQGKSLCTCGRPIECIDVTRHMSFDLGNAIKYIWRAGAKDDYVQDLKKAEWYIKDAIAQAGG